MGFTTTKFFPQAVSPTAYQIGQYGRTPVSYFHGLPQISVPLTEVRGRGFTLPVSLSYHGGGIKPEQHPGWVGLGWSLHAGGSITRVIHGMKDEMSISEYNHLHQESNTDEHPGYLYHIHEIQNDSAWNSTEVADRLYTGKKDYSPDEYIVNAPGISASFVIVGEHELRVISRDESAISLEGYDVVTAGENSIDLYEEGTDNSAIPAKRYDYIRRIILRDKEGNRYVFGGTEESIEYDNSFFIVPKKLSIIALLLSRQLPLRDML